jgi:mono/diheme cytochrome c family protein
MKLHILISVAICGLLVSCARHAPDVSLKPAAFGSAIVESSGGKQVAPVGSTLEQPVIVQVNDAQGNGVPGALVRWHGPSAVTFNPAIGLTDSSGQFTSLVTLGGMAGRYRLAASTVDRGGKSAEVTLDEVALGSQEQLGQQLSDRYCIRCHDPESTPERVSNMDNLDPKPHAFTDGDALGRVSDSDLASIVTHGGAALNKSPQMPPYGFTLGKDDIQAIIAYIRAIQDPPFQTKGLVYAQK